MSVVAASEIQVLRNQKANPVPLQPRATLNFACRLLELFGQRYANAIREQLGSGVQAVFDQVHRALFEIQKRLQGGATGYAELACPETRKIIEKFRIGTQSDIEFFSLLKGRSYGILPFPQRIVLYYKDPELEALESIETVRSRAFYNLSSRLNTVVEDAPDRKGDDPPPTPRVLKPMTEQEEMAATQLYFAGGAVVYERRTVYFSEMVGMWQNFHHLNSQRHQELLEQLSAREWAVDMPPKPIVAFTKYHQSTFPEFLVYCTIEALQKNLQLDLSPAVEADLAKRLVHEQTRSDLAYFSVDQRLFYEQDFARFKRPSATLIRSFQLYFFITRNFEVHHSKHNALLMMLLNMRSRWNPQKLPNFSERHWHQAPLEPEATGAFHNSWEGLHEILNAMTQRNVSFTDPSADDLKVFRDLECWDLLEFLWEHPERKVFIRLLCNLAKLPNFKMNLTSILDFCRENKDSLKPEMADFIPEKYGEVIQALTEKGIQLTETQYLFFAPPFTIIPVMSIRFGTGADNAKKFVDLMSTYQFNKEKEYCLMLRQYILHPHSLMFELLKDVPAIGAEVSQNLLWEALSKEVMPFEPEEVPSPQTRIQAKEIAGKIQAAYGFSDTQIFSIYIELLRLVMNHQEAQMGKASHVIHELVLFCPSLKKEDIYFLFRYHPDIAPQEVALLADMRAAWAKNEVQLRRFVINQEFYNGILVAIKKFVTPLSQVCHDEFTAEKFQTTCQHSLLSAFFPPLQVLSDYFRITNVTEAEGMHWGQDVWRTHTGQLKFILGQASVGIYLNWAVYKDRPVLFLSFFDIRKGEAFSAFIPINVSAQWLAQDHRRKPFYNLMAILSQVLGETAIIDPPEDAPETPQTWIPSFTGVQNELDNYQTDIDAGNLKPEDVEAMWAFFRKVKLTYRNLFLTSIAGRRLPDFSVYEPKPVAALGHIFSSHPRGSLLPKALLDIEPHVEFYIPDADPEFVAACRPLFAVPKTPSELLNLDLKLADGQPHPVSYQVLTADQLTGQEASQGVRNEVAPQAKLTEGRYVTLSTGGVKIPLRYPPEALNSPQLFQRYFDYHILLLKAACYNAN